MGTVGGLVEDIKLKEIIVGTESFTDSNYAFNFGLNGVIWAVASFDLLKKANETAKK